MSKKKKGGAGQLDGFEDWGGYMAAKISKLEEQFVQQAGNEFPNATTLFKGIAIFVNGYTDPPADELRRLMMIHGGTYHQYMRPQITTHVIASNLPYSKIVLYRKAKKPHPICKPEWITDSIKAKKLLNPQDYLLYTNHTSAQPQLLFQKSNKLDTSESHLATVNEYENIDAISQTENDAHNAHQIKMQAKTSKDNSVITKPANPKEPARCTKDSGFLSEFYSNSRLHHISTMGATFKDYVNELREKSKGTLPGLEKLKQQQQFKPSPTLFDSDQDDEMSNMSFELERNVEINQQPIIMHIDMDCFFVSVGLRKRPELRGLPVAVTHAKGNKRPQTDNHKATDGDDDEEHFGSMSEIASCSYEARKAGLKNGMFMGQALKLCPNLKTIPYDFEGYKEVSYALYNTVASYTLDIEAVSCDEMYADCTKLLAATRLTPLEFATVIRNEIKAKTGCPVSTGFGNNKLQARLATKKAKPDGQFYLRNVHVESYIGTFNVRDLPGVGYTTAQKLNAINVNTCAELQLISLAVLQKEVGKKLGESLHNMCRGIDNSKLNVEHVRKSVSAEVNYGIRFENNGDAVDFLKKLSEEVCGRLKKANGKGKCITLKLMVRAKEAPVETLKFMGHGPCDFITKSKNVNVPVDDLVIITKEVISIWNQLHQIPEDIRGIGIQISRLEILKHKSNNSTLMNFVNKSKQQEVHDNVANQNCKDNVNHAVTNIHLSKKTSGKNTLTGFFSVKEAAPVNEAIHVIVNKLPHTENSENTNTVNLGSQHSVDESFLDNLPEDIKNEILTDKGYKIRSKTKELPPVDAVSESSEKCDVATGTFSKNFCSKEINSSPNSQPNIQVPSQDIDDSILKELPEDIRNEVLNLKAKQKDINKKQNVSDQVTSNIEPVPGPSTNDPYIVLTEQHRPETVNLPVEVDASTEKNIAENRVTSETPEAFISQNRIKPKNKTQETRVQMDQEDYFKHKKPSFNKPTKVEMPPMQAIDMSVLIELPEDIRNEILNEYKANKDRNTTPNTTPLRQTSNDVAGIQELSKEQSTNEHNVSFSQVDPEFLAALSEDMKRDVRMYCMANKKENRLQNKQNVNAALINNPSKSIKSPSKKLSGLRQEKKSERKVRNVGKGGKAANHKNKSNGIITLTQHANKQSEKNEKKKVEPVVSCLSQTNHDLDSVPESEAEAIILHNRTIVEDNESTDKYQEMLISLVNHLLNLPIEQVKMQIQTWITKSKTVNEVDFLSLATFLSMLPGKKRIEDLHTLLKTMHRCMTKSGSCIWHRTYRKTVKHVQQYMQIEYNSNLMVPPIRCNLLECNSDDVI